MTGDPSDNPAPQPPPLPPVIPPGWNAGPGEAPPVIAPERVAPAAALFEGRLHPMTLAFSTWAVVQKFIIPFIVVLFLGRNQSFSALFFLLLLIIPIAVAVIRYFTFTYRIENGELVTAEGLFGRTERNIPLSRVQDIRIEQGLLHRLFDMADVRIETAGGRGPEASLSVLAKPEAERLRAAIFEQVSIARGTSPATQPQPVSQGHVIRTLSVRELVVAGLTSNQMASVLALLAVGFSLVDDLLPETAAERIGATLGRMAEELFSQGLETHWVQLLAGAFLLVAMGMIFSVTGSILLFYQFTLVRNGEDLHRSFGLLTRRSSSLPRRRIQVLKIEEKMLRRLFHLATLRADTAGSRPDQGEGGTSGHDVLLPAVPRDEVEQMLPEFFPDFERSEAEWKRVSRRAIRRGTAKGSLVCLVLAWGLWTVQEHWIALWPLALIPLVFVLNVLSYRHLGYWMGERFFCTRRGWLSRATHIVPIRNTQAVVIRQTPFDRRHRVATLIVDTAGQANTGGGPRIDNLPWNEALTVARTLARRAAETRYRWKDQADARPTLSHQQAQRFESPS